LVYRQTLLVLSAETHYINQANMLSKNQVKLITSLSQKKHRDETGLFVAEGTKLVLEIAHFFQIRLLVATAGWASQFESQVQSPISIVTQDELSKISGQKTPQGVLAVFEKNETAFSIPEVANSLSLALDDVQDPGNLGTIIRLPIGLAFGIYFVRCIVPMRLGLKQCRPQWAHWPV